MQATFALFPDLAGRAPPLAPMQQPIPVAGEHVGEPGRSSLRREPETAWFKPGTDLVLLGHAQAPGGEPVTQLDAGLRVGATQKIVRVFGDRAWTDTGAGLSVSGPQPFQRLPLVWERAFGGKDAASEGAFDQPYEWPAARIRHAIVPLPVPVGFWRSVGHSHQAFFKESFVDECAAAAGQDPVAFRLALLKKHPRHAAVLKLAADKAGWGQPLAPAADGAKVARGVALHQSFGTIVAQVVEASVAADKTIRVHRVVAAVDCGTPVNPNHIAQQMESAVVFALTAALYGRIDIHEGVVQQGNFPSYPMVRLAQAPRVETWIVPSQRPPAGVGEPGVPPLAPAVAAALYQLTGKRLRNLPLAL